MYTFYLHIKHHCRVKANPAIALNQFSQSLLISVFHLAPLSAKLFLLCIRAQLNNIVEVGNPLLTNRV